MLLVVAVLGLNIDVETQLTYVHCAEELIGIYLVHFKQICEPLVSLDDGRQENDQKQYRSRTLDQ
jgi:hypothetical protein